MNPLPNRHRAPPTSGERLAVETDDLQRLAALARLTGNRSLVALAVHLWRLKRCARSE